MYIAHGHIGEVAAIDATPGFVYRLPNDNENKLLFKLADQSNKVISFAWIESGIILTMNPSVKLIAIRGIFVIES